VLYPDAVQAIYCILRFQTSLKLATVTPCIGLCNKVRKHSEQNFLASDLKSLRSRLSHIHGTCTPQQNTYILLSKNQSQSSSDIWPRCFGNPTSRIKYSGQLLPNKHLLSDPISTVKTYIAIIRSKLHILNHEGFIPKVPNLNLGLRIDSREISRGISQHL
jgi:hypothetical protein